MKKFFFLSLGWIFFFSVKGQENTGTPVYQFTFEDCINYAFHNNLTIQSFTLNEESQGVEYEQSKRERLPNLNASLSESFSNRKDDSEWEGSAGLTTNVPIYQGGTITNTIERNKLLLEQTSYQTSQYENTLTIQILQAFLSVLGNEELLKYQRAVVIASEEQLNQGRAQYSVGSILESDYLLLEAQYANDLNNVVNTEISRDNNLLNLKNLLSMDPLANLDIISPDTSIINEMAVLPYQEYVLERALVTLPDLKISQYNVDIAEVGVKLSKAGYLPTVSLNGSIGTGHTDFSSFGTQLSDRFNQQVGVTVSIPIFDRGSTRARVTQSKISLRQAELDQQQTELNIIQEVAAEYLNVRSAYNQYRTTDIRQNAYFRTYEAYKAQFTFGSITAVDLLQQQNNYISALNDYIQSKYEFILRRKILDVYMGEKVVM
ncbi:MAG: TolC family protein [Candidatus Azobacteroides sp.]|nr:TolC family protein [Candidatus Azobacteroides sp.]